MNTIKDDFRVAGLLHPALDNYAAQTNAEVPRPDCRPVEIQKVENGFIVRVGCKTFVSNDWSEVWVELGAYFADPNKAALKWLRRKEAHG